jgi:cytochrome c553
MEPIAVELSDRDIGSLARYFGSIDLSPRAVSQVPREQAYLDSIARGERLARVGAPNSSLPGCTKCHGPDDEGRNVNYPLLAGQSADYLRLQLELFQTRRRGGTSYGSIMHDVIRRMSQDQMRDVSRFYESLAE